MFLAILNQEIRYYPIFFNHYIPKCLKSDLFVAQFSERRKQESVETAFLSKAVGEAYAALKKYITGKLIYSDFKIPKKLFSFGDSFVTATCPFNLLTPKSNWRLHSPYTMTLELNIEGHENKGI